MHQGQIGNLVVHADKVNILFDPGIEELFGKKLPAAIEIQTK